MNQTVLMSGADYFTNDAAINAYMDKWEAIDKDRAMTEHAAVKKAFEQAGIQVVQVPPPEGCQDGVYTANWALCRNNTAILSSLPNARQAEQPYAKSVLESRGFEVIEAPHQFSGQGDALPCGSLLFMGSGYRTDQKMHQFVADTLGFQVIRLQTVPQLDDNGKPVVNEYSGWPDSFFYDIDLALSVLRPDLIAWCPEAFMPQSQEIIQALDITKIEVSLDEAMRGFACNLVSTGETVIMSSSAPRLRKAIEAEGLRVITPTISELAKGGGYIRCTSLTLDN